MHIHHKKGSRRQAALFFAGLLSLFAATADENGPISGVDRQSLLQEAERLIAIEPEDPQLHFIRGMALLELGHLQAAVDAFRRVLTIDPKEVRPRLELARALALLQQNESARYHFEQALAADIPDVVRRRVEHQLSWIRERTGYFQFGLDFITDTNPNQATQSEEVVIRGLRYTVSNDGRANRSSGIRFTADTRQPIGEQGLRFLRAQADIQSFQDSRFDFQYAQIALGQHFPEGARTYTLELGSHAANYGQHNLYNGLVFASHVYEQLRPDLGAKVNFTAQQFDYNSHSYMNAWQHGISSQIIYVPHPDHRLEAQMGYIHNDAAERPYRFHQGQLSLRYSLEWSGGWITGLNATGSKTRYQADEPLFEMRRNDEEYRIEMDIVNRRWRIGRFSPRLQIGRLERHSSIDFFNYTRDYLRIGLTGTF